VKIPPFIIALFLTASLGLQGWTLSTVVDLKADVAALKVQQQNHLVKN
jgi:hypothetical protein